MNDGTLYRASLELDIKGRTLEGLAMPWDKWAVVRDLSGPAYPEAHARSSFDESLRRDAGPRPLYSTHEYMFNPTAEPVGVAHFERSTEALMFRAFLSRTRKADEQLELVKDGAKRAVSVGFRPLKSRAVQRPEGRGQLRLESMLRELSITPTGFGQYPESRVLALRSQLDADATFDDVQEAVSDAVEEKLFGPDKAPDGVYLYVVAIGDGWVICEVEGASALDKPQLDDTWRYTYAIDANGAVTLNATPERVEQQWVPVAEARSELASASATPRLDAWKRKRSGLYRL